MSSPLVYLNLEIIIFSEKVIQKLPGDSAKLFAKMCHKPTRNFPFKFKLSSGNIYDNIHALGRHSVRNLRCENLHRIN